MSLNFFKVLSLKNDSPSHRHLNTSTTGGKRIAEEIFILWQQELPYLFIRCADTTILDNLLTISKVTLTGHICWIFAAGHRHFNHHGAFYQMVAPTFLLLKGITRIQMPFLMRCSWKCFVVTSLEPVPGPQMNLPQCEHVEKLEGLKKKKEIRTSECCITLGG